MWHDFIILEPDSHWVVWVVQNDPKDKTQGFESFDFWAFCRILPNLKTWCESGLSCIFIIAYLFSQGDVYESFILFKGTLKFTGALENIHDTNHG